MRLRNPQGCRLVPQSARYCRVTPYPARPRSWRRTAGCPTPICHEPRRDLDGRRPDGRSSGRTIGQVALLIPGLIVERLQVTHPADDDNVYFIGDEHGLDRIQLDTHEDGQPPFYIENGGVHQTSDVSQAVNIICSYLRRAALRLRARSTGAESETVMPGDAGRHTQNVAQLREALDGENIDKAGYRINEPPGESTWCLRKQGKVWLVYWSERGERFDLQCFSSERTACEFFLHRLRYGSA